MKNIEFKKSVNIDKIVEVLSLNEFDIELLKELGNGVIKFEIGSRGEIECIEKVSDDNKFVMKDVEDIEKEILENEIDDSWSDNDIEELKEFICSSKEEYDGVESYGEGYYEELGYEYYWIVSEGVVFKI